jgi:hypothetical protein
MNTITLDIINPKAANLLKDLEDLNLISIKSTTSNGFSSVLNKLRIKSDTAPSLLDITKEVEVVRSKRYGK